MSSYLKSLKWNRESFAPDLMSDLTVAFVIVPTPGAGHPPDIDRNDVPDRSK